MSKARITEGGENGTTIVDGKEVPVLSVPTREEVFCANCGYEVDEAEEASGICTDCGKEWREPEDLRRNVSVEIAKFADLFGATLNS
jgi:DNA-directed RNA polymerase subunit RPC12/RpoP